MSSDKSKVFQEYNSPNRIYGSEDKCQRRTYDSVQGFVEKYVIPIANEDSAILNVASATNSFGLPEKNMQHFDITSAKTSHFPRTDTGSRECIQFSAQVYDIVVCTGSVLNYADPMEAFEEFSRVLRPEGFLVLEFENSNTLELLFTKNFNKKAVFVNASDPGKQPQWHYSDSWIDELLELNKFEAVKKRKFNYSFSDQHQFAEDENSARIFFELDPVIRFVPFARNFASNTIVLCQKKLAS